MSKVTTSVRWSLGAIMVRRLATLGLLWVITAFISQEAVGVFQELVILVSFPMAFVFLSLDLLFIAKRGDNKPIWEAMFAVGLPVSIAVGLFYFFAADWLGGLYNTPSLAKQLHLFWWLVPAEALRRMLRARVQKYMLFKRLSIAETTNVLFYGALLGLVAWKITDWRGATLLTGMYYAGNLLEAFMLVNRGDFKAIFAAKAAKLRQTTNSVIKADKRFCTYTTLTHFVGYFADSMPVLVLGALFSPAFIGIYFLAVRMVSVPANMLSQALTQVFFAAFATATPKARQDNLKRYIFASISLVWPAMALYVFVLHPLLPLILPAQAHDWLTALPLLAALGISTASSLLVNPLTPLIMIANRTDRELYWVLVSAVVKMATLAISWRWGFTIALYSYGVVTFIMHLVLVAIVIKISNVGFAFLATLKIIGTLLVTLFYCLSLTWLHGLPGGKSLTGAAISTVIAFVAINILSQGQLKTEITKILRRKR